MLYKDDLKAQERRKRFYYNHREESIRETAKWRESHKEQRNKTQRKRNAERRRIDPQFRERERARAARAYLLYRESRLTLAKKYNSSEAVKARQYVREAIQKGILVKPQRCDSCDSVSRISAHHDDYSKPLIVRWLCPFCHGEQHQKDRPVSDQLHQSLVVL